jgi:hypothetical protein
LPVVERLIELRHPGLSNRGAQVPHEQGLAP